MLISRLKHSIALIAIANVLMLGQMVYGAASQSDNPFYWVLNRVSEYLPHYKLYQNTSKLPTHINAGIGLRLNPNLSLELSLQGYVSLQDPSTTTVVNNSTRNCHLNGEQCSGLNLNTVLLTLIYRY